MSDKPDLLAVAYEYVFGRGWSVIPLLPRSKKPAVPWEEFQARFPTADELDVWFSDGTERNVGIVCGGISGNLVVLDGDGEEGERTLAQLRLPRTPRGKTPHGQHVYLRGDALRTGVRTLPGVDVRGEGGYAVAPPSVVGDGEPYSWVSGHSPDDVAIAPLPAGMRAAAAKARKPDARKDSGPIREGERNDRLASLAGKLRRIGASEDELFSALSSMNGARCLPPLPEDELRTIAASIGRYEPNERPKGADEADRKTSWDLIDIDSALQQDPDDLRPCYFRRSDGEPILYRGRIHWFFGRSEMAKTWGAYTAVAERIRMGELVLVIDFEDNARLAIDRLRTLGLTDEQILAGLLYISPSGPLDEREWTSLSQTLALGPTICVVDSCNEGLGAQGLDGNSNRDIPVFMNKVIRRIRDAGPTVIVIDHLPKDGPDDMPIGAQAKLSGLDGAAFLFKGGKKFERGVGGHVFVYERKDRPGFVRPICADRMVGTLRMNAEGAVTLEAPGDTPEFRPTGYMERVSHILESSEPISKRALRDLVGGRHDVAHIAIDCLVHEGYFALDPGKGGAHMLRSLKPFREGDR